MWLPMIKLFLATCLFLMLEILVYTIYCVYIYTCIVSFLSPAQAFRFGERLGIMLVYPSEWLQKNCSCSIVAVRKTFARFHGCIGEIVQSMWLQEAVWRELFPGFQFNIQHLMQKGLLVCCKAHSCIRCSLLTIHQNKVDLLCSFFCYQHW